MATDSKQSLGKKTKSRVMSSPLSMLKKTRRSPLRGPGREQWGRQQALFRRIPLTGGQSRLSTQSQAEVANDDVASEPAEHAASEPGPSQAEPSPKPRVFPQKGSAAPSDVDLMSVMMQRLTQLEKTTRSQELEIKRKDTQISVLEEKLTARRESESTDGEARRLHLERRCQELQDQVQEMESFLNDYGLIWVGDGMSDAAQHQQAGSSAREFRNFRMNFDLVLQRIKELNILAGEGESFVQSTGTGARLAPKDPMQLRLYSNGIVMFDGPFRSYQEHSTQLFMQDLMEGYFPSELQERFPDGVPFKVHDKRNEEFIFKLPWDKFPGEGQAVCEEKHDSSKAGSSQLPGKRLRMDQFLNTLPRVVVKAGRVISVRDSLRATLLGSADVHSSKSVVLVDTPVLQARLQTLTADRPSSAHKVVTLKLKSEDGSHTYIVKMSPSETVGHLRQYLDGHRGGGAGSYDVISAYPQCCYDDDSQTLQSCGLATNATLLLRKRRQMDAQHELPK